MEAYVPTAGSRCLLEKLNEIFCRSEFIRILTMVPYLIGSRRRNQEYKRQLEAFVEKFNPTYLKLYAP